jgi:hypothetical protein
MKVTDDAQLGCPIETVTEVTVHWVEELILADRRIMVDRAASALGSSHVIAYSIMHDHLKFWKVCIWWVPRELKDGEEMI